MDFIEEENVAIPYMLNGVETSDDFVISSIPAFHALPIYRRGSEMMAKLEFADLPDGVVSDLLRYVRHDGYRMTLSSAEAINRVCYDANVVFQIAVAMWKKNFSFFKTRKFPKLHENGTGGEAGSLSTYQGIDPLFAYVIRRHGASLWELKNRYSLEDCYSIWESFAVPEDNEATLHRRAQENAKMKRNGR